MTGGRGRSGVPSRRSGSLPIVTHIFPLPH